ncbi:alpha/beta fold hydrolase [Exiguobacterium acetylicum]|uniref:alpha/beta fold hydrolase n=1 Tax=Exiguobacterium acetylicum TaxID=41170 RepID=UPI001EE3398D|nr:alpha/beta fold hydrolase [Exiguobacterium acetylicum]UKS57445.1 alpha/beta fold hydrolase [Exiguobacterium acetylicum]
MKRYTITCQHQAVHITEWGTEDLPTIVCLHGLGSTSLSFIEIAEALASEFRIIALDLPGHGKTPAFADPLDYRMKPLTDWIGEVLDELGVQQFYALSHSWGSVLSLYYLIEHADRVLGTILIDGGYHSKRLYGMSVEEEVAFYERDFEDSVATWDEFLDVAVYAPNARRSPALNKAGIDLLRLENGRYHWHARGETAAAIVRALHYDDVLDFLADIPASPIQLYVATLPKEQAQIRQQATNLLHYVTNATIHLVPETGHLLHWDRPDVIIDAIRHHWTPGKRLSSV